MLFGQYESKIDQKSRIVLPKRVREVLGDEIIVTRGYEGSLIAVPQQKWEALLEGSRGRPFIEYETREIQRYLLGGAIQIKLDSKGRFILPDHLRTFAGIKNGVIFIGLENIIEIWDEKVWAKHQKESPANIAEISQKLVRGTEEERRK